MNPEPENSPAPEDFEPAPPRIVTDWRRLAGGNWRIPRGDIDAAYSAQILPRVKTFSHEGRLFTNLSGRIRAFYTEACCYPLISPDEYHGPEPQRYSGSYEGYHAKHAGRAFRLGPKHLFIASEPTIEECRRTLRVIYADSGRDQPDYAEFLAEYGLHVTTANPREAVAIESQSELRSLSKAAMLEFLAGKSAPSAHQLELGF